jgi:hypothetical protein
MLYVIEASLPPGRPKLANLLHDVNNTFADVKKRHQLVNLSTIFILVPLPKWKCTDAHKMPPFS